MKTIEEIRQGRLLELLGKSSLQAFAEAIGRSPTQVSQWKNRFQRADGGMYNIDSESARNIERKLGKPVGWMDNEVRLTQRRRRRGGTDDPAPESMGATVARWLDLLPEAKRLKAFWLIHQMVFADEWPAASGGTTSAEAPAEAAPSPAPKTALPRPVRR